MPAVNAEKLSEALINLADELRQAGYDVGAQQYIAAQDLIIALVAHGRLPEDPRRLTTLLAPIFCSTPGEQADFSLRFNQWLKRHPDLSAKTDVSRRASKFFPPEWARTERPRLSALRRRPKLMIAMVGALLLIGAVVLCFAASSTHHLTGTIVDEKGKPIANAQVSFLDKQATSDYTGQFSIGYKARNYDAIVRRKAATLAIEHSPDYLPDAREVQLWRPEHQRITLRIPQPSVVGNDFSGGEITRETSAKHTTPARLFNRFNILLVLSPLLLFIMWLLFRWVRRTMLEKRRAGAPDIKRIIVEGASERLFDGQEFRRVAQELRRHRHVEAGDLDVPRTMRATISRGGMFTPFYGSRRLTPEYLLLIDRASVHDEQARIGDELFDRLRKNQVFIERYYFQSDPRSCRGLEPNSPAFTLQDLTARHHNHCVLLFSDGAGLFSTTGEPESWLADFSNWPRRALLTPERAENWGYRERSIEENDFIILPATKDGLAALAETITTQVKPNLNGNYQPRPFPDIIRQRPKRWLEDHEPQPVLVERLCDSLKRYLSDDGWYWLSACAVYPALTWDITLYLGYKLLGLRVDFEERLLALTRLPWFRYGVMPDWLRSRLIASLTRGQGREVRNTIEKLLISFLKNSNGSVHLEFAKERIEQGRLKRFWQDVGESAKRIWRRIRLRRWLSAESEESELRDYVFLSFMSGRKPRELTVNAPNVLKRALYQKGQSVLGWRPITIMALAALTSITVLITLTVRQPIPNPELAVTDLPVGAQPPPIELLYGKNLPVAPDPTTKKRPAADQPPATLMTADPGVDVASAQQNCPAKIISFIVFLDLQNGSFSIQFTLSVPVDQSSLPISGRAPAAGTIELITNNGLTFTQDDLKYEGGGSLQTFILSRREGVNKRLTSEDKEMSIYLRGYKFKDGQTVVTCNVEGTGNILIPNNPRRASEDLKTELMQETIKNPSVSSASPDGRRGGQVAPSPPVEEMTRLTGQVNDPDGAPISGATVRVDEIADKQSMQTTTNSNGGFIIDNIPAHIGDRVRVYISKGGYEPFDLYIALPGPVEGKLRKGVKKKGGKKK
jgi:hypothetical protein